MPARTYSLNEVIQRGEKREGGRSTGASLSPAHYIPVLSRRWSCRQTLRHSDGQSYTQTDGQSYSQTVEQPDGH